MKVVVVNMKVVIVVAFISMVAMLSMFNPEGSVLIPKCIYYNLTGYECPSCGIQRSIYNLLHLNFVKAFSYNPFLIISIPYGAALTLVTWFDSKGRFSKLKNICYHQSVVLGYVVLMVTWWIVRNL